MTDGEFSWNLFITLWKLILDFTVLHFLLHGSRTLYNLVNYTTIDFGSIWLPSLPRMLIFCDLFHKPLGE